MIATGFATHRCKECGAFWTRYPTHWSLYSTKAGTCCDNEVMGDQIEPIADLMDQLMIETAYARHVELPASESARRILSLIERGVVA